MSFKNWNRSTKRRGWLGLIQLVILTQFGFSEQAPPDQDGRESYIVFLKKPSVVQELLGSSPDLSPSEKRAILQSPDAALYRAEVEDSQSRFIGEFHRRLQRRQASQSEAGQALRLPGFEVIDRRAFLANMLVVRANQEAIQQLNEEEEVAGIYSNLLRFPLMDKAPEIVNALQVWEQLGGINRAGMAVRIGVIDSGIRQDHPMFRPDGLAAPPGFPRGSAGFTDFTNSKVIVARAYPHLFPDPNQPDKTPRDEFGHGSQVAGIAAGRETSTSLGMVRGIAPMAFLGSYKVFGDPVINPAATSAALLAALNDAVEIDKMDIINLSLGGSPFNPEEDPEQQVIKAATLAGVIVVVAAGNTGPRTNTVTSPGTSPEAVTVGSVSHGRVFAPEMTVSSEPALPADLTSVLYTPGQGVSFTDAIGPLPLLSVASVDRSQSELACQSLPADSLKGRAVLVRRGECLFQRKADNVSAAGAVAMIVYNNLDNGTVVMGFDPEAPLPSVMIEKRAGEGLHDFLKQRADASITLQPPDRLNPFPSEVDRISSFSGRGPNIDRQIKPDLMAIGQGVLSASNDCDNGPCGFSLNLSGTSFSTPMVAGAAALLRQLHPDWSAREIKSALVNTALKTPTWNGDTARLILSGNGRLDVAAAAHSTLALRPVSQSFGLVDQEGALASVKNPLVRQFEVTNRSDKPVICQLDFEWIFPNSSAQLNLEPAIFSLDPEESQPIQVKLQLRQPFRGGSFEGFIRLRTADGAQQITASVWGGIVVEDSSVMLEVSDSSPAAFTSLQEAIDSARPGNIIEVGARTDDQSWPGPVTIDFNQEGLPLRGVTVRGKGGSNPVLAGSEGSGSQPLLSVQNLSGVRLQGLTLRNSPILVEFLNSSGELIGNTLRNEPENGISAGFFGVSLNHSQAYLTGNLIQDPQGTGIAVFESSALIVDNRVEGSNSAQGLENGIFASSGSELGIFENRISGASAGGQAIRISDADAAIKGNLILNSRDKLGDGILLRGSAASAVIQDNWISGNSFHGISLFEGSVASILRNRIESNADSGLFATNNSSARIHSVELLKNGLGISAEGNARVLVSDSVIAGSLDQGISARELSDLTVINSTLAKNRGFGIQLEDSASLLLANSIVFGNQAALSPGGVAPQLFSNLMEGSQFAGQNGNLDEDPLFIDPPSLDFRLQENSPAVDRGSNERVASRSDLFSHQRIVAGPEKNQAVVDLGAIEVGSDRPVPLILPVLSSSAGEFVGLAMTNAVQLLDSPSEGQAPVPQAPAEVLLRAWNSGGESAGMTMIPVAAGRQASTLLKEAFPGLSDGWIEIIPSQPDLMSFTILGNTAPDNTITSMDGARLSPAQSDRLVFPEIRSGQGQSTTFYVVNPGTEPTTVTFSWISSSGNPVSKSFPLAPRGMLKRTFRDLFSSGSGGYLMVTSNPAVPLYGMEIFGSATTRGGLLALEPDSAARDLFGAQMAGGNGVQTFLNVIAGGSDTEILLEAFSESGEKLGSTASRTLKSGQQLRESADSLFGFGGAAIVGWVRIHASQEGGALLGSLSFEDSAGRFLAALPLQSQKAREFIFSHVANDSKVFTGVTLLNSSFSTSAVVSLEVFTPDKILSGKAVRAIGPGQKLARLLNEWVPGFADQSGGFIRIRSSSGLFGFELFGAASLEFLAAVPAQVTVF